MLRLEHLQSHKPASRPRVQNPLDRKATGPDFRSLNHHSSSIQPSPITAIEPRDVIHVTEACGGGVASAISDYVRAVPEVNHHLVYAPRPDAPLPAGYLERFTSVTELSPGHTAATRTIRSVIHAHPAAVIHAHSSFAGAYVRLATRTGNNTRIVYTPHCYSFERADLPWFKKFAFRMIEITLAPNTASFACCSRREVRLSERLPSKAERIYVPNVAPIAKLPLSARTYEDLQTLRIVATGRLGPQKDPAFFLDSIREMRRTGIPITPIWIGGGDPLIENDLINAGVRVTGWLTPTEVLTRLAEADIYLHTGAWEGFPISILEADAVGTPVIARTIPAFENSGLPLLIGDPADAAHIVSQLLSGTARRRLVESTRMALHSNTRQYQRSALISAWGYDTQEHT